MQHVDPQPGRRGGFDIGEPIECGCAHHLEGILASLEAMRDCARRAGAEPATVDALARAFMHVDAALGSSVRELHEIAEACRSETQVEPVVKRFRLPPSSGS